MLSLKLKIWLNEEKLKRRNKSGLLLASQTSWCPKKGQNISMPHTLILVQSGIPKKGGLDELEEVEDEVDDRGQESQCRGPPLPKHFSQVFGNHWENASGWGLNWQYQVLVDLVPPLS